MPGHAAPLSIPSTSAGVGLTDLSPATEWRRGLTDACLNSPIFTNHLDQARQIYIAFLAECVTQLEGNNQSIPDADLVRTPCDMCSSDLQNICVENGGRVCAVDVVFEREYIFPTEAPANNDSIVEEPVLELANFAYRFYECIPPECENEADEAVFAAGWTEDLSFTFGVEEQNARFETFCPREDVDPEGFVPGANDTVLGCDVEYVSEQCFRERTLQLPEFRIARNEYYSNLCPCYVLPRDVGDDTEAEWGCLCHTDGREFEEQCFGDEDDDRIFCSFSMSFFRDDATGNRTHYNITMFDCLPSECDNPFDRYAFEHFLYEEQSGNDAFDQYAGRFESYCYSNRSEVPAFFFTEECDRAEETLRGGEGDTRTGSIIDTNTEDRYLDAANECVFDALRAEPRSNETTVAICDEHLGEYNFTCSLPGDARLCAQSIQFSATIDPDFGAQTFAVLMYQCVPDACATIDDVKAYEFRDRFDISSVLGIEDPRLSVIWDCPPLYGNNSRTFLPEPMASGEETSIINRNGLGIGVAVVVLIFASIAVVAGVCFYRRRTKGHARIGDNEDENATAGTANDEFDDHVNHQDIALSS